MQVRGREILLTRAARLCNSRGRGDKGMSKIKQHLESELVITNSNEESTGWKRYIAFDYEGNSYELTLFWEEFNGYDTYWRVPEKAPTWVYEWDSEAHQGMSFEHYLDDLTWEMNK
jgi:hypothetical protein